MITLRQKGDQSADGFAETDVHETRSESRMKSIQLALLVDYLARKSRVQSQNNDDIGAATWSTGRPVVDVRRTTSINGFHERTISINKHSVASTLKRTDLLISVGRMGSPRSCKVVIKQKKES